MWADDECGAMLCGAYFGRVQNVGHDGDGGVSSVATDLRCGMTNEPRVGGGGGLRWGL